MFLSLEKELIQKNKIIVKMIIKKVKSKINNNPNKMKNRETMII